MDSLTQLILGAAVGEIALGKKIGNRAMIWGAIGGTIPDLDVIGGSMMSDIDALAFHRGITHSIFFSVTAAALFGWLVHRLYATGTHRSKAYKTIIAVFNFALLALIAFGINYAFRHSGLTRWWVLALSGAGVFFLVWRLYRHYWTKELEIFQTNFREWYWLFFLALATHWMLDCFTAFGTQIFLPFSNYRVAFNNIAVADPFYTAPFLACILIASALKRSTKPRFIFTWLGIGISSCYMLFTIINKHHVDGVFNKALHNRNLEVMRCRTTPTIFNNFLWACVAEAPDRYYAGQYSIFDSNPNLHHLSVLPKNDSIRTALQDEKDYHTLEWFSDGYLVSFPTDSILYLCDIRFGGMGDTITSQRDLVFNFKVTEEDGKYVFRENREPPEGDFGEQWNKFWTRVWGY